MTLAQSFRINVDWFVLVVICFDYLITMVMNGIIIGLKTIYSVLEVMHDISLI